jgi:acyl-CoA reductase-like NAD-dependent aldehyde dehydrogenase
MSSYTVINPADESIGETVEHLGQDETDEAIGHAVLAQETWADVAPADKARILRRFAEVVDGDRENLAAIEVRNSGHPITQARWEAAHVRDVLDYYAAAPERMFGQQIPVAGGIDLTFHEPLGVVGVITPWNFPMTIGAWGFAPALAAGNAVILKPAEWTPLSSIRLGELALDAGLPEGLFQVLPGRGSVVGTRFVTHSDVRKVVFTGSTAVGKQIMAGCADQVKRVTLELGGKSANIVFADADLERAAAAAPSGVFENAGQDCCARSRILCRPACSIGSWSCLNRPSPRCGSAIRPTRPPRWAPSSPGSITLQCRRICPEMHRSPFVGALRPVRGSGSPRPCSHPPAASTGV